VEEQPFRTAPIPLTRTGLQGAGLHRAAGATTTEAAPSGVIFDGWESLLTTRVGLPTKATDCSRWLRPFRAAAACLRKTESGFLPVLPIARWARL